jgi:thymidylate synthase
MHNYNQLATKILEQGIEEQSRIGSTISLHNEMLSFDLNKGFPLMTTKHVGHKSIIAETLWYLKGTTSITYLKENGVHVWDKFADEHDEIGKTYSWQFRNFNGVDQVKEVIRQLNREDDITDRRAIINLYNVSELNDMSIPPCVSFIQFNVFYINGEKRLDTSVYQRSADLCLGVPYDIAEMALLTHIIASYTDSKPNNMTFFFSNVHVYTAHIETLKEQLKEEPTELPTVTLNTERIKELEPEELTKNLFKFNGVKTDRKKFYYELF